MRWLLAALLLTSPAWAETPAEHLDSLLDQLRTAPNEDEAATLEQQLLTAWLDQATPALRLLLVRGTRELNENNPSAAFDSFDAVLDLDPELLEGWRGRAQARLRLGDGAGATHDILEVLHRQPRDVLALKDLSRIAEARGDWRGAFAAWQKVLEADPLVGSGRERLRELRRKALGEAT